MSGVRVGVLGGGQLARMMALEGHRLGVECVVVSDREWACSAEVATYRQADLNDTRAVAAALGEVEVVTYEVEHLPAASVAALGACYPLRPGVDALVVGQDRVREKQTLEKLGIRVAPWAQVDDPGDLERAAEALGLPLVLKTRREGYDGRGQVVLRTSEEVAARAARGDLADHVVEGFVEFSRELSQVAVRGATGEVCFYPLVENQHRDGQLVASLAPAPAPAPAHVGEAQQMTRALLEELEYVGVLTLELFETPAGLVANELAPRVHNSGHWTLDGAVTSQFENHLRAILGWPLGVCAARGPAVMVNVLGEVPPISELLGHVGAHVHLYGKAPRPARKVGHVTVVGSDRAEVRRRGEALIASLHG